jgi:hypothetical protein
MSEEFNIAAIRRLIHAAFTPKTLRRFLRDHSTFRPILDNCGADYPLADMVDEIIPFCQTQVLWNEFLDEVEQYNPKQYARFAPQIRASAHSASEVGSLLIDQGVQVIFYERFDSFDEWSDYGRGSVSQSSFVSHAGDCSLMKHGAGDPNGGYRRLGMGIDAGFVFSGWIFRPRLPSPGNGDRLAVEDARFNGYGFTVAHQFGQRPDLAFVERRDNAQPSRLDTVHEFSAPREQWYQFEFVVRATGEMELRVCDSSGANLCKITDVSDDRYRSFDRVVVHGGYVYYVDELKIQRLSIS